MLTQTVTSAILSIQSRTVTKKEAIQTDAEQIARNLMELRAGAGKARAEVAANLGISVSALTMYENGARIPRDEMKIKIAAYYGKSVQEIFYA